MTTKSFIKTIGSKGLLADYNTEGKKLLTELTAGDAIDLTNNTISAKYGKGLEITTDNKLQLKVGEGLALDNDTLDVTIKDLATSITDFRTGDVIAVDGPSGTAKMSKDDLLKVTAENAVDSIHSLSEVASEDDLVTGNCLVIDGNSGPKRLPAELVAKRSVQDSLASDISKTPKTSEDGVFDYSVSDENGNVIVGFKDGNIFVKRFNSLGDIPKSSNVNFFDFSVCDENGNVILGLSDGNVFTKNFNSRESNYKSSKNYGKSVGVFGGSLSVFPESQAAKNMWRRFLNLDITDYGVGGAGFSSLQGTTPIQAQVDGAAKKDIYILWASTNDYTNSRQIGEYSDYTYLDGYDSGKLQTQCGGINYCIKKLYEKNPMCEIYFFTGIDFFSQEGGYNPFTEQTNAIGKTYQEYVNAQKKCCEFFSIPVLDQNAICGLNIFNYTSYFKKDNLHMEENGYLKIAMQQVQFLSNGL